MSEILSNADEHKKPHLLLPTDFVGIIFDCDGVILNSRAANALYYNKVLAALGLKPLTDEQESFTYMATVREALEYIIPKELHPKVPQVCKDVVNYKRDIMPHITLEDGFMDFINWAKSNSINMAVHTNRFDGMPAILETFNLHGFFDLVMTAADATPKPSPAGIYKILEVWKQPASNVVFIGDSSNDQQAAMAAQMPFIAYKNQVLEAALNIDSFAFLKDLLQKKYICS